MIGWDTCQYMDDNECPGVITGYHEPHNAKPDIGRPVTWEDGEVPREGHICVDCGHVVAAYPYHTDPRLDLSEPAVTR